MVPWILTMQGSSREPIPPERTGFKNANTTADINGRQPYRIICNPVDLKTECHVPEGVGVDKGSLIGLIVGVALVLAAILMGSGLSTFFNVAGLLIVCGGTLAAVAIAFPARELKLIVDVTRRVFREPGTEMRRIMSFLLDATRLAKKEGNLGLEQLVSKAPTKPVAKGLQLIADGADAVTVREILSIEKTYMEEHHRVGQRIFSEMGKFAPAFGMVGTLIGLVQMLASLSDPSAIGPKMAVALLTTFYGAVMANLIFLPMVTKLDRRIKIETIQIELTIVGMVSLLRNDNVAIMNDKMEAFMAEQEGDSKPKKKGKGAQKKAA